MTDGLPQNSPSNITPETLRPPTRPDPPPLLPDPSSQPIRAAFTRTPSSPQSCNSPSPRIPLSLQIEVITRQTQKNHRQKQSKISPLCTQTQDDTTHQARTERRNSKTVTKHSHGRGSEKAPAVHDSSFRSCKSHPRDPRHTRRTLPTHSHRPQCPSARWPPQGTGITFPNTLPRRSPQKLQHHR